MNKKLINIDQRMYTNVSIDKKPKINEEERTIVFSFASRKPFLRWFGYEVIDTKNMDLTRLKDGAPILFNHNSDEYLGVVEDAWYDESDERCYVKARFDTHEQADKIFKSIISGILKNVSFGYEIKSAKELDMIEDVETYEVKVLALEVTISTVPADETVGINRSNSSDNKKFDIEVLIDKKEEKSVEKLDSNSELCDNKENSSEINVINDIKEEKNLNIGRSKMTEQVSKEVLERNEIIKLGRSQNRSDLALDFIERGKSLSEFKDALLEERSSKASVVKNDEAEYYEKEGFQFGTLIKSIVSGEKLKGVYKERHDNLVKQYGQNQDGSTLITLDMLKRSITVASPTSAGNFTDTNRHSDIYQPLGDSLVLANAGALFLDDLVGVQKFPKANNIIDVQYVEENKAAKESDLDTGFAEMNGKDLSANISLSRSMQKMTSFNLEKLASRQILEAITEKLDYECLFGKGGSSIKGLVNYNIESITAKDGEPTWRDIISLESLINAQNNGGKKVYVSNTKVQGLLKSIQKATGLDFITNGLEMNTYKYLVSNMIENTKDTEGNVTDKLFMGDFSKMYIGTWGALELKYDPNYDIKTGMSMLVAFLTADMTIIDETAFSVLDGIKTGI